MSSEDCELDPRIQIELENLNTATNEINKIEIELEEANSTFRILLNESTRRLKLSSKKLGNCIEKARPYYDALEKSRDSQIECQKAAVQFQRSTEIHAAAKETVALAEQRFMSNSHEWQFDNAWQEMLNHATQKVMDAEKQKADSHAEHQRRAKVFSAAEMKVQQLEERFRRSIAKSRPYFEEKQICQDQLQTQKNRIQELQAQVQTTKLTYATALRNLERISDDIHRQRGDYTTLQMMSATPPPGPREPGVGAELNSPPPPIIIAKTTTTQELPDFQLELERCEYPSITTFVSGSQLSLASRRVSLIGDEGQLVSDAAENGVVMEADNTKQCSDDNVAADDDEDDDDGGEDNDNDDGGNDNAGGVGAITESDLEALRQKVKILAVRPIEGGDGQQQQNDLWEHELNATVNKLDQLMLMNECARGKQQQQQQQQQQHLKLKQQQQPPNMRRPDSLGAEAVAKYSDIRKAVVATIAGSLPTTPQHAPAATDTTITTTTRTTPTTPLKKLQKQEPPPSSNVSMRELPLLARLSHELLDRARGGGYRRRRRSLE